MNLSERLAAVGRPVGEEAARGEPGRPGVALDGVKIRVHQALIDALGPKLYDPQLYFAHDMADDAARLLDLLGHPSLPVMGYSMGARISAYLALRHPERVTRAVWGGMGLNLVSGLEDSEEIIAALTADSLDEVKGATGRQFRIFADHSKADRPALAACMISSREPMPEAAVRKISQPTLVAVGAADDMAGDPEALAKLLPRGEAFVIPKRNHMLSTGDPKFKAAALEFLGRTE